MKLPKLHKNTTFLVLVVSNLFVFLLVAYDFPSLVGEAGLATAIVAVFLTATIFVFAPVRLLIFGVNWIRKYIKRERGDGNGDK